MEKKLGCNHEKIFYTGRGNKSQSSIIMRRTSVLIMINNVTKIVFSTEIPKTSKKDMEKNVKISQKIMHRKHRKS